MTEYNYNLHEAIDEHLDSIENKAAERDYFYVSEVGRSKREIYDKIVNRKPFVADARVKRILDNGNYVHERFIKIFAEMGILVCAEINAVKNDLVHGRLDAIISDRIKNYIVEIKSCSMWTFNKLEAPTYDHNLQIQFYMYYLNIPQGYVLYENKNDQAIKCFYVKLDKKLVEGYIKELEYLKECIDKKHIPEDKPITLDDLENIN